MPWKLAEEGTEQPAPGKGQEGSSSTSTAPVAPAGEAVYNDAQILDYPPKPCQHKPYVPT